MCTGRRLNRGGKRRRRGLCDVSYTTTAATPDGSLDSGAATPSATGRNNNPSSGRPRSVCAVAVVTHSSHLDTRRNDPITGYLLQVGIGLLVVVFFVASIFAGHLGDFLALIYPLFRALSCIFELMMIIVSSRPWRAFDADEQRDDVVSSLYSCWIRPKRRPDRSSFV